MGGFGRRTSDAKVRILREKCLENLENFARELELSFGENEVVFIGVAGPFRMRRTGHLVGILGEVHDL